MPNEWWGRMENFIFEAVEENCRGQRDNIFQDSSKKKKKIIVVSSAWIYPTLLPKGTFCFSVCMCIRFSSSYIPFHKKCEEWLYNKKNYGWRWKHMGDKDTREGRTNGSDLVTEQENGSFSQEERGNETVLEADCGPLQCCALSVSSPCSPWEGWGAWWVSAQDTRSEKRWNRQFWKKGLISNQLSQIEEV